MYKIRQGCEIWAQPWAFDAKYGSFYRLLLRMSVWFRFRRFQSLKRIWSDGAVGGLKHSHRNVREGPGSCGPDGPAAVFARQASGETSRGALRGWVCSGKRSNILVMTVAGLLGGIQSYPSDTPALCWLRGEGHGSPQPSPAPGPAVSAPPHPLLEAKVLWGTFVQQRWFCSLLQICPPSDCTVHTQQLITRPFHKCFPVKDCIMWLPRRSKYIPWSWFFDVRFLDLKSN